MPAVKLERENATGKDRGIPPYPDLNPSAAWTEYIPSCVVVVEAERLLNGSARGMTPKERNLVTSLIVSVIKRVEKLALPATLQTLDTSKTHKEIKIQIKYISNIDCVHVALSVAPTFFFLLPLIITAQL